MIKVKFNQEVVIPNYPAFKEGEVHSLPESVAKELESRGVVSIEVEKMVEQTSFKKAKRA